MKSKTPPEKKSLKKSVSPLKKSKPAQKGKNPVADSKAREEIKKLKGGSAHQ